MTIINITIIMLKVMASGWFSGKCERTGKQVNFPGDCVYVLPTIARPPSDVLLMFANQTAENSMDAMDDNHKHLDGDSYKPLKIHTLEKYSYDHFRY